MKNNNSGTYYKKVKGQSGKNKCNDYSTPNNAWDEILDFIEKEGVSKKKVIYEPFYLDGGSGNYIKSKGWIVNHEKVDFYNKDNHKNYDFILSNPPYDDCKSLFKYLDELNKPFMLLLPTLKLHTNYVRAFFQNKTIQVVIPRRRVHFMKYIEGKPVEGWKNGTTFDCVWVCFGMGFEKDISFAEKIIK